VSDERARRAAGAREARRAALLAAATPVFAAHGYYGTSVDDIVEAAGVARGTFYLYFDGKDALFRELIDVLLRRLRGAVLPVRREADAQPPAVQLRDILVGLLETLVADRAVARLLFREALGHDAALRERMRAFQDELRAYVRHGLRLGIADGFLAPMDTHVVADCVVGTVQAVVVARLVDSDAPFDVDAVADAVLRYALFGLTHRGPTG
jgi:AcrR family transcriptional regulator